MVKSKNWKEIVLVRDEDTFHNFLLQTSDASPEYSGVAFVHFPIISSSLALQQLSVNTNGPPMQGFSDFICIKYVYTCVGDLEEM